MYLEISGLFLDVIGTVLVAMMALRVHHTVMREHKIDEVVFQRMRREQVLGFLGVIFVILGFILQMISRIV